MNKIIPILIIAAALAWQLTQSKQPNSSAPKNPTSNSQTHSAPTADFEHILQQAFQNRQSNLQIQGSGTVSKILPDDNEGSRHQRFILKLRNGQTILVAHNIDLAPKIKELKAGDIVDFYGKYEWNKQGGVIHWTHHDPAKRHTDGWLKHNGQTYQ
ncbi:DUF3465 domain-containing protein [Wielerella bovis]|uniref:DUF3465 domain-containing protein n=1 Tax=Wielerella bovis TaxID=2917790 RepID=UPI0020185B05|nr:DUF3465 domain-containing protein [Wielerella bovis]ULJ59852.1 DUF3465 domain-containing protein [Wielerella bovis]ULJ62056.1 DUF3465 domain-containing protein [Wielerella bovis]ULJ64285.1 DUF3465 domain-containing protein [Wielerella bovis]ULJ66504.1 DUF3465 domain-containing protein [Wielerella bovis]